MDSSVARSLFSLPGCGLSGDGMIRLAGSLILRECMLSLARLLDHTHVSLESTQNLDTVGSVPGTPRYQDNSAPRQTLEGNHDKLQPTTKRIMTQRRAFVSRATIGLQATR